MSGDEAGGARFRLRCAEVVSRLGVVGGVDLLGHRVWSYVVGCHAWKTTFKRASGLWRERPRHHLFSVTGKVDLGEIEIGRLNG
jgi:hypothetical protein